MTPSSPWMSILKSGLTKIVLHHPDLQLNEAVGVEAVVLPPAAIADFMATKIQLAMWTQGSDFGITDCILLQNVNQAPIKTSRTKSTIVSCSHSLILLHHIFAQGLVRFA